MNNKSYKIIMSPKKFILILEVPNYGHLALNLYSKLEEVEKQELIFLHQNEDALNHRYLPNKSENEKNCKDKEEIELIVNDKNDNFTNVCHLNDRNNLHIDEEKDIKEREGNLEEEKLNKSFYTHEVNFCVNSY